MTSTAMPPAIRHWLNKRTACTISWITADGQAHHLPAAGTNGWGLTPSGVAKLVVRAAGKTVHVDAESLQRWLDRQGISTRPTAPAVERCQDCGKPLGSGRGGYMDEYASVAGYCYDCA